MGTRSARECLHGKPWLKHHDAGMLLADLKTSMKGFTVRLCMAGYPAWPDKNLERSAEEDHHSGHDRLAYCVARS
jgi:hypothetical protein